MESVSSSRRSDIMRRVRSLNTAPEMRVRKTAHALGYRFRLHRRDLPGKPDLVFPGRRKVIFVHGCFWHQHPGCKRGDRRPRTNTDYWDAKLAANRARDSANTARLTEAGWGVLVIWECETHDERALTQRLKDFLGPRCNGG